jgi:ribose 1,5-bisphosphate isomerase
MANITAKKTKTTILPKQFLKTVSDIQSIKIQGAKAVAKAGAQSLQYILIDAKKNNQDANTILQQLNSAKNLLFSARPTEPALRNAINNILSETQSPKNLTTIEIANKINARINETLSYFNNSEIKIADHASRKIRSGMVIFTHCHSSTVTNAIIKAHKDKKRFFVRNTETRPLFQGRITATELAKEGIPVTHYIDSAARIALKEADIFFIGADAITAEGYVINKVGSEMFATIANEYDIPVYVLSHSWKFDPMTVFGFEEPIEERHAREVWKKPPKGVTIHNHAFEKVHPKRITGIISELGIHSPANFVEELRQNQKWMFEKRTPK